MPILRIITKASDPIMTTGWKIRLSTSLSFPNHSVSPVFCTMPGVSLSNDRAIAASGEKLIQIRSLNILIRLMTIKTKSGTQNATSMKSLRNSPIEKFFRLVMSAFVMS